MRVLVGLLLAAVGAAVFCASAGAYGPGYFDGPSSGAGDNSGSGALPEVGSPTSELPSSLIQRPSAWQATLRAEQRLLALPSGQNIARLSRLETRADRQTTAAIQALAALDQPTKH